MSDYLLISGDSHFVEPPSMWAERMDKKFRDRAPHTVKDLNGKPGRILRMRRTSTPMPVAGFFGAGVPSQDLAAFNKKGFEAAPKSVWDRCLPAQRSGSRRRRGRGHLHLDGDAAVSARRRRIARGRFARLQRLGVPSTAATIFKRLVPLGSITLEDIPAAVAELNGSPKKGMRGAMIWAEPADDNPYSDRGLRAVLGRGAGSEYAAVATCPDNRGGGNCRPRASRTFCCGWPIMHHAVERTLTR